MQKRFGVENEGTDLVRALQVAFLAAKYWNGIWQQQHLAADRTDLDFESWDNATTSLQQALALARARQDFISEAQSEPAWYNSRSEQEGTPMVSQG